MKKTMTCSIVLLAVTLFYHTSAAQELDGQEGMVCTSYNECSGVEVGYFIYPNPAKDVVYIDLTSKTEATIILDLYDAAGREVAGFEKKVVVQGREETKIDLTTLPNGYYFIRIKDITRETLETIKFMKS